MDDAKKREIVNEFKIPELMWNLWIHVCECVLWICFCTTNLNALYRLEFRAQENFYLLMKRKGVFFVGFTHLNSLQKSPKHEKWGKIEWNGPNKCCYVFFLSLFCIQYRIGWLWSQFIQMSMGIQWLLNAWYRIDQATELTCFCEFNKLVKHWSISDLFGIWTATVRSLPLSFSHSLTFPFLSLSCDEQQKRIVVVNRLNIITSRSESNHRNSLKMYFFFFLYYPFPSVLCIIFYIYIYKHTHTHVHAYNQCIDLIIIPVICEQLKWCDTKRSTEITYAVFLGNEEVVMVSGMTAVAAMTTSVV